MTVERNTRAANRATIGAKKDHPPTPAADLRGRLRSTVRKMTLSQRFMLASLLILITGMAGIAWWVGQQIETGVIRRTAGTVALYVNSFVSPHLQSMGEGGSLSADDKKQVDWLLSETEFGQHLAAFKVWGRGGVVIYSTSPAIIGQRFTVDEGLRQAWQGEVAAEMTDLHEPENVEERVHYTKLLSTYMPVRLRGTDQVIAVAEFYQTVTDLENEIFQAQLRSWLIVGIATLLMYLLLAGFVKRTSDTIVAQQGKLNTQVLTLTGLLGQNKDLGERVRRAAARTTALNERFLRRVSADLHDGPAQDISLALLRLDRVIQLNEDGHIAGENSHQAGDDLMTIQNSLQHAMQEVRAISAGLALPELGALGVAETATRAVRAHERRTSSKVTLVQTNLPEQAPLPVKITLYRLIQEGLNNAFHHAGGRDQYVAVSGVNAHLEVEVADSGPGFAELPQPGGDKQLGLAGMRERVESLGGLVTIASEPGQGTRVLASIPLAVIEQDEEERAANDRDE